MCGLCGVLGVEDHWTDTAASPAVFAGRKTPQTRRHERQRRAALANRVLSHYGMSLSDWQGARYLLATATGRTLVVDHLAALWPAATELAKSPCDPLDPALIASLERAATTDPD